MVALTKTQFSRLERRLGQQFKLLLEQVRDALENSENQQYVELINRAPADSADQATGGARHVRPMQRDLNCWTRAAR
jgi:hypothetical protein